VVRAAERLKKDQARLLPGHECRNLLSRELLAELDLSCPKGAMDLENTLCQIDPDHHIPHLAVLSVVWLITPRPWHIAMPSWEGSNHSI
jgi:hypothetical protein